MGWSGELFMHKQFATPTHTFSSISSNFGLNHKGVILVFPQVVKQRGK